MTEKTYIKGVGEAEIIDYSPTTEEEKLFQAFEDQAEKDIEEKTQNKNVNFRWSEFEIKRAKKIAKKLGIKYQTYLKSTLKQGMDNDEKRLMQG